jgi:ankyrin repeat protein
MWAAGYAEGAGALDAEAVVKLVLDRGADIDARDNRGRTSLMMAADAGHAGMIDVLLARGAARDLKDKDGRTALDLAADNSVRDKLRAK